MKNNSTYRPEIDGLRAAAVLLVILHHLGLSALSGGYIGVDVFFVISGFLITQIIVKEIQDGTFSISGFYKRRIIRLAPAYFLVLIITTLASMIVMLPAELLVYFKSVIYSTLFLANLFMWQDVGGYFGILADKVPLLHLWSLAVEEQFYIFWPLILLGLCKVFKPKHLWIILAIAGLIGLYISEYGVYHYRAAAYYLMPTRAFELLIGALTTVVPRLQLNRSNANAATLLGLLMILVPAFRYSITTNFPGVNALAPCIGTALIIAFSHSQNNWVGRVLASAPMNFIGRISYPAYLWHWPLIVFLNIYLIKIDSYVALAGLATTLLLSTMTYWFIELPAKRAKGFKFTRVAGLGFALPAATFLSFSVFAQASKGWPQRFDESYNLKSTAILSYSQKIRGRCNEGNIEDPLPPDKCILGLNKPGVDILLIGDSYANHYTGMIDVMAQDAGLRAYDITQSYTIYLPEAHRFYIQDGEKVEHLNFYLRNKAIQKKIKKGKYKYVVLGASFSSSLKNAEYALAGDNSHYGKQVFMSQLDVAIQEIIQTGAVPYLIKGNPIYSTQIQDCTLNNKRFNLNKNCDMSFDEYRDQIKEWDEYLNKLTNKYPLIKVIDPAFVICDSIKCHTEINGVPVYRDGSHLNDVGSRLIGSLYIEKFGNPFK